MYQITVCDDEKEILSEIVRKVKTSFEDKQVLAKYTPIQDARDLMNVLENERVDVLFLDIDMPYFSGMDIAGFIKEKGIRTILVFVTSHDALVYQTFTYRPFGFIRKTHIDEELEEVVERIQKELLEQKQELVLTKGSESVRIRIKDILYIESAGNYLNLFLKKGRMKHRETMTKMEEELAGKGFIRCHKGYLVNSEYIQKIKAAEIEMKVGEKPAVIPIGRSYEKEVKRKLMELFRV